MFYSSHLILEVLHSSLKFNVLAIFIIKSWNKYCLKDQLSEFMCMCFQDGCSIKVTVFTRKEDVFESKTTPPLRSMSAPKMLFYVLISYY
jgi:hypothetical protein